MTAAAVSVFLILATAAVAAFGVTRNLANENERRLLHERAGEVVALLRNSVGSSNSALGLLAVLATAQDRAPFEQGARALARTPGTAAAAFTETDGRFTVTARSVARWTSARPHRPTAPPSRPGLWGHVNRSPIS